MADSRDLGGLKYGQAGNVVYVPRDSGSGATLGELHASRRIIDTPTFHIASPWEHCYTSTQHIDLPDFRKHRTAKRNQKRWLRSAHPQTFAGFGCLADFLDEEADSSTLWYDSSNESPCFEIGEIVDAVRSSRSTSTVSVIAKASGSANEILHIIRLQDIWFQWNDSKKVSVRLRNLSLLDKQEEVFWSQDATPITGIKFAHDVGSKKSRRWLLVQKQSGTAILQPEHHSVPIAIAMGSSDFNVKPSRINPRLLTTITTACTGGRPHSDMAFAPSHSGQRARIAIIDEMGYWTIWEIRGSTTTTKTSIRTLMLTCGHANQGILPSLADPVRFPAEDYGISLCSTGQQMADQTFRTHDLDTPNLGTLVVWNDSKVSAYDLETSEAIAAEPKLGLHRTMEFILDIQRDPSSTARLFVLTTRRILWLAYVRNFETNGQEPHILNVTFHCPSNDDDTAQISTSCVADSTGKTATLVMLHSVASKTVKHLWFRQLDGTSLTQVYQQSLPMWKEGGPDFKTDALRLASCAWGNQEDVPFLSRDKRVEDIIEDDDDSSVIMTPPQGLRQRAKQVHYHQMFSINRHGRIGYWLCATAPKAETANIVAPDVNVYSQANRWAKIIQRRKQAYMDMITPAFVIPDGLENFEQLAQVPLKKSLAQEAFDAVATTAKETKTKRKFLGAWMRALRVFGPQKRAPTEGASQAVADAIMTAVEDGVRYGVLPYKTLMECTSATDLEQKSTSSDALWASSVSGAFDFAENPPLTGVVSPRTWFHHEDISAQIQATKTGLAAYWPCPKDATGGTPPLKFREWLLSDVARCAVLAANSVTIPASEFPFASQDTLVPDLVSSQPTISSSPPPSSVAVYSQSSSQASQKPKRSPKEAAAANERRVRGSEALKRLSQYAVSIALAGDLQESAPHHTLDSWPKESGVSTDSYISSQARVHIARDEALRKKREAIEAKKRRKALKYGFLPDGGPASSQTVLPSSQMPMPAATRIGLPENHATQIFAHASSQTFALSQGPMSQPMPGAFGARTGVKPAKKKQKKGGIK